MIAFAHAFQRIAGKQHAGATDKGQTGHKVRTVQALRRPRIAAAGRQQAQHIIEHAEVHHGSQRNLIQEERLAAGTQQVVLHGHLTVDELGVLRARPHARGAIGILAAELLAHADQQVVTVIHHFAGRQLGTPAREYDLDIREVGRIELP
ncbi:hypothetical protein SteCoe_39903 [Stentor coeruleus]|uniref:Uncharacterized protein n=1 Tax=Stentor coeruleus TaxID=5963 RepID=A0A1R2AKP1_9CILI|nr:hypothetical protein SteCoe_39903 [Stentor coeruleus]